MVNLFFNNKYDIHVLKHIDGNENWFNWSFDNGKAFFRVESNYNQLMMISKIVKYDFDISNFSLSNPIIHLFEEYHNDFLISYEDPRYTNGNLGYSKVCRNKNDGHIRSVQMCVNDKEFPNNWEKNWYFYNEDRYIHSICPFAEINEKFLEIYSFDMPEWDKFNSRDTRFGLKYFISTNIFHVDDQQFVLFHTKKLDDSNVLNYYQGVIEIKDGKPFSYSKEPLFYPSRKDSNPKLLEELDKFRIINGKTFCKYNVFYAMSVHCVNNEILIAGGLNECQSVLYKLIKNDFLNWYNNKKRVIND